MQESKQDGWDVYIWVSSGCLPAPNLLILRLCGWPRICWILWKWDGQRLCEVEGPRFSSDNVAYFDFCSYNYATWGTHVLVEHGVWMVLRANCAVCQKSLLHILMLKKLWLDTSWTTSCSWACQCGSSTRAISNFCPCTHAVLCFQSPFAQRSWRCVTLCGLLSIWCSKRGRRAEREIEMIFVYFCHFPICLFVCEGSDWN